MWPPWLAALLPLVALVLPPSPIVRADSIHAGEYEVKAAFLLNFARFAEWPPAAFPTPDAPIVFGVLGDDPFGPVLDATVQGKRVGGRSIVVRRLRRPEDAGGCHLVFIAASERAHMGPLLRRVSRPGVLTVGETDRFAEQGGVIQLTTEGDRGRLTINTQAAARAEVRLSAKILSMARLVPRAGEGRP